MVKKKMRSPESNQRQALQKIYEQRQLTVTISECHLRQVGISFAPYQLSTLSIYNPKRLCNNNRLIQCTISKRAQEKQIVKVLVDIRSFTKFKRRIFKIIHLFTVLEKVFKVTQSVTSVLCDQLVSRLAVLYCCGIVYIVKLIFEEFN